jgi:hypothetical protein
LRINCSDAPPENWLRGLRIKARANGICQLSDPQFADDIAFGKQLLHLVARSLLLRDCAFVQRSVPFSAGSESISPIGVEHDPVSPRRRIEAAEHLLDYECPEEVRVECKEFLTSIFDDDEQQVDIRLDALKLARKFEAAKVTPRTIHTTQREGDRREAWRRYEISQRHWKLSLAIHDTPPKGWADDLYSDAYVAPDGWPPWG